MTGTSQRFLLNSLKSFFLIIIIVLLALLVFAPFKAFSQSPSDYEPIIEWEKRQGAEQRLTAYGPDLMGDGIDPATGDLTFNHVDVDIPGNFDLPVRIERKRSMGEVYMAEYEYDFADWELSVPKIHATTTQNGEWRNGNRCSASFDDSFPIFQPGSIALTPFQYYHGINIDVPGRTYGLMLYTKDRYSHPAPGPDAEQFPSTAKFVTTDDWYFTCISANQGEGLKGHAPNGDIYFFDYMVDRRVNDQRYSFSGNRGTTRHRIELRATEVRDVNGNTVNYNYDAAGRLTSIQASDGRQINVNYSGSNPLIQSVSVTDVASNTTRTWNYGYRDTTFIEPDWTVLAGRPRKSEVLSTVTQPDQKQWVFKLDDMFQTPKPAQTCTSRAFTLEVTHPYGTKGRFRMFENVYRASESTLHREYRYCPDPAGPEPGQGGVFFLEELTIPFIRTYSVNWKELEVNGVNSRWNYGYGLNVGDRTNNTFVTDPLGHRKSYAHYWPHLATDTHLGAKLKSLRTSDGSTGTQVLLQLEEYDWIAEERVGFRGDSVVLQPPVGIKSLTNEMTTTTDGNETKMTYVYDSLFSSPTYSFGQPIQTTASGDNATDRVTTTTYEHKTGIWVLGLPTNVSQDNTQVMSTAYDTKGRPEVVSRFGQTYAIFTYHDTVGQKGAPHTITQPVNATTNRVWTATNWKRGVPQTITRPDTKTKLREVDDNGWVKASTDAKGKTDIYTLDSMGRLLTIDPRDNWSNTDITYTFNATEIVQSVTRGDALQTITYDTMFRPVLTKQEITGTNAEVVSYTNSEFDIFGRASFTSFPSLNSAETLGTETEYDGLGRAIESRVNGDIVSTVTFGGDFSRTVSDAKSDTTTHYNNAFGELIKIVQPLGITTEITRDNFGKPTELRQSDVTGTYSVNHAQKLYYDAQQRLCRHHVPEAGSRLYKYDLAGQVIESSSGMPDGADCAIPSGESLALTSYTDLGQISQIRHTGSPMTPYFSFLYDSNGNMRFAQRYRGPDAFVQQSYLFNSLNLPTQGTTRVLANTDDGTPEEIFITKREYTLDGNLKEVEYPGGRKVYFNPDALGRMGNVSADGVGNLALSPTYHPSGAVAGFNFGGAGGDFSQTLDTRLRPLQIKHTRPGNTVLDLTFGYDDNNRIDVITDAINANQSRNFFYDAVGRLTEATATHSLHGKINYGYDGLGNLRTKSYDYDIDGTAERNVTLTYRSNNTLNFVHDKDTAGNYVHTGHRWSGHDSRGNIAHWGTVSGGKLHMVYDMTNQPVQTFGKGLNTNGADSSGAIATHLYDAHKRRVKTYENGAARYNIFDAAGTLVQVYDAGTGTRTDYVPGPNGALAQIKNISSVDTLTFIHADHQGTGRAGTSASGNTDWTDFHTPFGESLTHPDATDNHGDYTGHLRDKETGLTYMQARYYDPVIGRFMSEDPLDMLSANMNPGMFGRYTYVHNDPVNAIDPLGLSAYSGEVGSGSICGTPGKNCQTSGKWGNTASKGNDSQISNQCAGPCNPQNVETGANGLPFSDSFIEQYRPLDYTNASQTDAWEYIDGTVGDWGIANYANSCAGRVSCALNGSGMHVPSSRALGSWPTIGGVNDGARILTEARSILEMFQLTGASPHFTADQNAYVDQIRGALASGQVAIAISLPNEMYASGHVGVITADYSDLNSNRMGNTVYLLPVRTGN